MPCVAMVPGTRPERLEVQTMLRKRQEPIRILPPVVEPMSEADFEEVTDLLADLILSLATRMGPPCCQQLGTTPGSA